ncbi:hypothetical protein SAMN05216184_10497 [Georgenia satyanarayanai]|uniref:Uncharacterized protein n=1 Tax=Georgenia satyanarayanai TaxID=860221 RepID=A0A2Y9A8S9_9MICO|nr:hypothetical protein [Georgenia satyanarayanai]PYG00158.1 hypothetical protein A8987_10497 [Georgenia satyanarayanai]SSA40376.1 hypothetical protein SAMN05216184_10497 [Georgenia satyanarayanai]
MDTTREQGKARWVTVALVVALLVAGWGIGAFAVDRSEFGLLVAIPAVVVAVLAYQRRGRA